MSGRKKRTNFFLLLLMILLCFGSGYVFQQATENPGRIQNGTVELLTEKKTDPPVSEKTETDQTEEKTEEPVSEPEPSAAPVIVETSPEAEKGVWTSKGSSWMFLVDGTPYTGWLTDTDGKRYFFNQEGIMQTGWVEDGGKKYFMDLDGIMQTGFVTTDGKSYELLEDGSLKGYTAEKKKEEKKQEESKKTDQASAKAEPTAAPKKKEIRYVALTFDDGPSSFTDRLLDCLEKNKAKATFFMVGKEIEYFSEEVKRMEKLGCELGNHTYSHADLTTLSPEEVSAELSAVDTLLKDLTGQGASVIRPPYGAVSSTVKQTAGAPMILWSIDTLDWESQDPEQITETVLSQVKDGSIILMHDIFSTSVDAVEILIPKLAEEGYQFLTVHELAEKKKTDLQPGNVYSQLEGQ